MDENNETEVGVGLSPTPDEGVAQSATPATATEPEEGTVDAEPEDPPAFPRSYVEKLRKENQAYRERAKVADDLAARLHLELARATGRLADPSDLPYDPGHLDDPDALAAAIDELLASKPHLASRRPIGDIGQGASKPVANVDLAALLRSRA